MKYATIDANGACSGFYDDPALAPQGALPIDDATWLDWINNQYTRKWAGGILTVVAPPVPPTPTDLQKLQQYQVYQIFLLTKLVNVLLGKNVVAGVPLIVPTDFDATTRSIYTKAQALLATALAQMPPVP